MERPSPRRCRSPCRHRTRADAERRCRRPSRPSRTSSPASRRRRTTPSSVAVGTAVTSDSPRRRPSVAAESLGAAWRPATWCWSRARSARARRRSCGRVPCARRERAVTSPSFTIGRPLQGPRAGLARRPVPAGRSTARSRAAGRVPRRRDDRVRRVAGAASRGAPERVMLKVRSTTSGGTGGGSTWRATRDLIGVPAWRSARGDAGRVRHGDGAASACVLRADGESSAPRRLRRSACSVPPATRGAAPGARRLLVEAGSWAGRRLHSRGRRPRHFHRPADRSRHRACAGTGAEPGRAGRVLACRARGRSRRRRGARPGQAVLPLIDARRRQVFASLHRVRAAARDRLGAVRPRSRSASGRTRRRA